MRKTKFAVALLLGLVAFAAISLVSSQAATITYTVEPAELAEAGGRVEDLQSLVDHRRPREFRPGDQPHRRPGQGERSCGVIRAVERDRVDGQRRAALELDIGGHTGDTRLF